MYTLLRLTNSIAGIDQKTGLEYEAKENSGLLPANTAVVVVHGVVLPRYDDPRSRTTATRRPRHVATTDLLHACSACAGALCLHGFVGHGNGNSHGRDGHGRMTDRRRRQGLAKAVNRADKKGAGEVWSR